MAYTSSKKNPASPTDGMISSNDPTYADARSGGGGAALAVDSAGALAYIGQYKTASTNYWCYEQFQNFGNAIALADYEKVVAAAIKLVPSDVSGSIMRQLELRQYVFQGGGLTSADWRPGASITDNPVYAVFRNINSSWGQQVLTCGSEALHNLLSEEEHLEAVITDNLFRTGNAPSTDERTRIFTRNWADPSYVQPELDVWVTDDSDLLRVGAASAQLSDGTAVYLNSNFELCYSTDAETEVVIGALLTGLPAGRYFDKDVVGWQTVSLAVDASDNIWVVGKDGPNGPNNLLVQAWQKGSGYTWSPRDRKLIAVPAYVRGSNPTNNGDVPINNIAVTWHNTSNRGHLMVIGSHRTGEDKGGQVFWMSLSCTNAWEDASLTIVAASGVDPSWLKFETVSGGGLRNTNPFGNGLDVATSTTDPRTGYMTCLDGYISANAVSTFVRFTYGTYTLTPTGTLASSTWLGSTSKGGTAGPRTRAKVLPLTGGRVAFCCAGVIEVWQGTTKIGGTSYNAYFSTELNDNGTVDYVYDKSPASSGGDSVWMYYIDLDGDNTVLRRNRVSMQNIIWSTQGSETLIADVADVGATAVGVRVPRSTVNERLVRVDVASRSGGSAELVTLYDSFNVAPNQPLLNPRSTFNADTDSALFTWTFSDNNTQDAQTRYQLTILDDLGVEQYDSGQTVSSVAEHVVPAGLLENASDYTWQVRTWDLGDAMGPYSLQGAFTTSADAVTTITDPPVDSDPNVTDPEQPGSVRITKSYLVLSWSTTQITQASYRLEVVDETTGATKLDTGFTVSSATTYTVTSLENGHAYLFRVTARNSGGTITSSPGERRLLAVFAEPPAPEISVTAEAQCLAIEITNPEPDAEEGTAEWNDVWKSSDNGNSFVRIASVPLNSIYRDFNVKSNRQYEYYVEAIA